MDLEPKDAELVVGIVARIGVDTKAVVRSIKRELEMDGVAIAVLLACVMKSSPYV